MKNKTNNKYTKLLMLYFFGIIVKKSSTSVEAVLHFGETQGVEADRQNGGP